MGAVMESAAIDLQNVVKTYGRRVRALRGIQMRVSPGEIFGLLGPNGAGKSTLVKIMMTVIRPTQAEGTLLGRPLRDKATLARVGYLPEHFRLPSYLTGRQAMNNGPRAAPCPRARPWSWWGTACGSAPAMPCGSSRCWMPCGPGRAKA